MGTVALEEHVSFPDLVNRISPAVWAQAGWPTADAPNSPGHAQQAKLEEIGPLRLRPMDEAGITGQMLSVVGPGAELLPPTEGPAFARAYNDRLVQAITAHPGCFASFAHLPTAAPAAAVDELARTVETHGFVGALLSGTTNGLFLDDAQFAPLLARAEAPTPPAKPSSTASRCPPPTWRNWPTEMRIGY